MMQKYFFVLLLGMIGMSAAAQQFKLTGTVKDTQGDPVSFASVYLKNTTKGTSANVDGVFQLVLDKGRHTLVYRAIGYKPIEQEIDIENNLTKTITLTPEAYTLEGVTISANAEDPAYAIIRQAIKQRKFHLNEIEAYSCDVYIKGMQKLVGAPKKFFGRDIQKTLDLDTNRKGILYLSESQSRFNHQLPDKIHEEMVSSKTAGRNNAFSFNKASDLLINFYHNIMLENTLSTRGFISPIADNAFLYYRYKLLGSTNENGLIINKIEVIARRENDPVFRGTIYIADDTWRLTGSNLYLTKQTGINLLDTLHISQQFVRVDSKRFMPSNTNFQFNGSVLGFKFEGYYLGVYNNYDINPSFPKGYFNGEILKITKSVNKKDSLYWIENRPIPLTAEEKYNYIRKDSIARLKESKPYLDSLEKANNKFGIGKILLPGYSINNRFAKKRYIFDPILPSLFYNTVEGFGIKYGMTYRKELEDRKFYTIRPEVRYGTANRLLSGILSSTYTYNPVKRASIGAAFGSGIYDLNVYGTMSLLSNSINSLLFETNHSKFYQKNFANIWAARELANGLQGSLMLEYARNKPLMNNTLYKLFDDKKLDFASNNPFDPTAESPLFPSYAAFTLSASLTYTPGQTFITRPDGKFYQSPKAPTFQLSYRGGIKGLLNTEADYHLLTLEISKERISTGMLGYSAFVVGAGKFLGNNKVYYPDFKHFRGNNALFGLPILRRFHYLDFYLYSTDRHYLEAHFEHSFAGFITNKIPLVRKLKLEELIGANYLTQPAKKHYSEFYFGLQRLVLRATYGFAYDGKKRVEHGFRFSYGF